MKPGIIAYLSNIRYYLLFNVGYVICWFFTFGTNIKEWLFFMDASVSELAGWYPRYYWAVYCVVLSLKVLFSLLVGVFIFSVWKKKGRANQYNIEKGYLNYITREGCVLLIFLVFYLLLYLGGKWLCPEWYGHEEQLWLARGLLCQMAFQAVVIFVANYGRIINYLKQFLLEPAWPYNIALLRILFFSYLIVVYIGKYYSAMPLVSLSDKVNLPYMGWLVQWLHVSPLAYIICVVLGMVACGFVVLGYKTRFFLLVNALCIFYVIATPNFLGRFAHQQIIIWVSWLFTLSRCYDVLSIDAVRSRWKVYKNSAYTFPVRLVWIQFGVIYLWSGFYKLWDGGFDWALGNSMVNQVQLEWMQHYDKVPSIRIDMFPLLLKLGGLLVIVFELAYIFFVLSPKLRWLSAVGGIFMHNVIGYFMYISFAGFLQAFYTFYIDFTFLLKKKNEQASVKYSFAKWPLYMSVGLVAVNFLFGMFNIHSYPFSAYPTYSALVSDSTKFMEFVPCVGNGSSVDVHSIGKKNGFQWEKFGWLEYHLIEDFENGKNVEQNIRNYWNIWQNHNPELREYNSVHVYLKKRPVAPEGRYAITAVSYMGFVGNRSECKDGSGEE